MSQFSIATKDLQRFMSRLRPFNSLGERFCLNVEGRLNSLGRSRMTILFRRYYGQEEAPVVTASAPRLYLRSRIHPYPGLGHQVSVWLAGYLWAQDLSIEYLGGYATKNGGLLDLTEGKASMDLKGLRLAFVRLPPTPDERSQHALEILQGAVARGRRRHAKADAIIFTLALDNPRYNQIPAEREIRRALLAGSMGARIRECESDNQLRVVLHIRRGDIGETSQGTGSGISRWISEAFYADVIRNLRMALGRPDLGVSVISLGKPEDFPLLGGLEGVKLCLNGSSTEDIVRLASADILIAAPSSFSFTAALASRGVVLALHPWWHEVPDNGRWFRLDQSGNFDQNRLRTLLSGRNVVACSPA